MEHADIYAYYQRPYQVSKAISHSRLLKEIDFTGRIILCTTNLL